jgi:hypothetical protein
MKWTIRCRGFDLGIFNSKEEARAKGRVLLRHTRWEVVRCPRKKPSSRWQKRG